jgi:hypothetical protein
MFDWPKESATNPGFGDPSSRLDQITLNHRVPGSSPGAPTKLFKGLAV